MSLTANRIRAIGILILGILGTAAWGTTGEEAMRILNWNVLYGFNQGQSLEEGVDWIASQAPDVAAFQELNGITEERLEEFARKWGHAYAATHKEQGFPVGLTSNQPIQVLERAVDGYHHGFLHCKTYGIHFFVVHFWPGRLEDLDRVLLKADALMKNRENVIILGDFNGCSRKDKDFLETNATLREVDYTCVDRVEAKGFVDLVYKHDPNAKISCPSPLTIPRWSKDMEELQKKRYRIDFVFADPNLAMRSTGGTILLSDELDTISDHYPVIVDIGQNER